MRRTFSLLCLGLWACAPTVDAPTEPPAGVHERSWDLFYRTAATELQCPAADLEVKSIGGETYEASGCNALGWYRVTYENANGPVILSDGAVRRNKADMFPECTESIDVYYYDEVTRNVKGCGKTRIVKWSGKGWVVDPDAKAPH